MEEIRINDAWSRPRARARALALMAAGLLAGLLAGGDAAYAQSRPFNQALESVSTLPRTRFGAAVAVGQRVAAIGAPGDSQRGPDAGAVHVYDRSAVTGAYGPLQNIQPAGLDPFDRFGASLAVAGNLLVVGAKGDDEAAPNAGAAYVYLRAGVGEPYVFLSKLLPPAAAASECYGYSVDVSGNRIVVGAPRADVVAYDAGAVYVYDFDPVSQSITQSAVLTDPAGRAGDGLGFSVAMGLDQVMVGAERLDVPQGPANAGGVLQFVEGASGQWTVANVLFAAAPATDSEFGAALAFEAPRPGVTGVLLVGAPEATAPGDTRPRGSVSIFEASVSSPWVEVFSYGLQQPTVANELGASLALQNGVALVGAPGRNQGAGAVDVLRRGAQGWELDRVVEIPDGDDGDRAGAAVALQNSFPVIGAEGRDVSGSTDRGWAWSIADLWAPLGEPYCSPAIPNSRGVAASLVARGSATISDQDLILEGGFLPTFSFSYAIVSSTQGYTPQPGSSQGALCLSGSIGRYIDRPAQAQHDGRVEIHIDLGFIPLPQAPVSAQPGETWCFQLWYRDANPQVTSNFTDAISVLVL